MKKIIHPGKRTGTILIPSSKSDCQRALLAAGLSKGTSILHHVGLSNDEQAMLNTIKQLGAEVVSMGNHTYSIKGIQHFPIKNEIHVGESGLGVRLLSSVVAAHSGVHTLIGHGSLKQRPLPFFESVLPQFSATVKSNEGFVPLEITGPMKGNKVEVDGSQSSQYISGLLMALPLIEGDTELIVHNLNSIPYLQMTLDTLRKFGIQIEEKDYTYFKIKGNQQYQSTTYTIESDWSSASYWLVASALGMDITLSGLVEDSLQADKALLTALENANCQIKQKDGAIRIDGNNRKAFEFDATHCPDLFPALVTLAASCVGTTKIKGVGRLEHKESNRGIVLQKEFLKLGLKIELEGDYMFIHGTNQLKGGKTESHEDHRIAMCLAIAAFIADNPIEIGGAEAVNKSYPAFWDHLENLNLDSAIEA
jgi:3-phosphoshikimate 1-carboxyvinyltransferase